MNDSWVPCPHCSEDIQADAIFCRHCGSSDSDGWGDDAEDYESDSFDDFDYDEFVKENYSETSANLETKAHWRFVSVALLLMAGVSLGFVVLLNWILR